MAGSRCCALALACLLFAGGARADETLYRWVTPDGQVHVGSDPPPRSGAVVWQPEKSGKVIQVEPIGPAAHSAAAAAPAPASRSRGEERVEPARPNDPECAKFGGFLFEMASAKRQLETLDEHLELLDDAECIGPGCQGMTHRDTDVARTKDQRERTTQRLVELQQKARALGIPPRCERPADDP